MFLRRLSLATLFFRNPERRGDGKGKITYPKNSLLNMPDDFHSFNPNNFAPKSESSKVGGTKYLGSPWRSLCKFSSFMCSRDIIFIYLRIVKYWDREKRGGEESKRKKSIEININKMSGTYGLWELFVNFYLLYAPEIYYYNNNVLLLCIY